MKTKKVERVECDFCGEEFDEALADDQCAEFDYCVCPGCKSACLTQLRLSGELEGEPDDDLFCGRYF